MPLLTVIEILLLDSGRVLEYDSPEALLSNESSAFSKMVKSTGAANAQYLRGLALGGGKESQLNGEANNQIDGQRRWLASSCWAAAAQFALAVSLTSSHNNLQPDAVVTLQGVLEGKHNEKIEESLEHYEISRDGWWSSLYKMVEGVSMMSRLGRSRLQQSDYGFEDRLINWGDIEA